MHRHLILKDGKWVSVSQEEFERYQKGYRGLGDLVHAIAQPIAKAIDSVAGTNIQGCNACKQRREALNKLVPRIGE